MNSAKIRYIPVEKLCLSLYHAYTKLEYYLLPKEVQIICKVSIVKYLINRLVLHGRLIKWAIKLNVFALTYVLLPVVKSQVMANSLVQHPIVEFKDPLAKVSNLVQLAPWTLAFDGSKTQLATSAGIVITDLASRKSHFIPQLSLTYSNN